MSVSSRLYHCCRCHAQVIICSRCDRGQRYCPGTCRYLARVESSKRAAKKYLSTRKGRFNNATRQQRFRRQIKQKVTHQGSTPKRLHDLLKIRLAETKKTQKRLLPDAKLRCHHCGVVCESFLRLDFLQRSPCQRSLRRFQSF